ncbi:MAG: tetratricopeptide repeat protein [Verrucomicrobiota bacterium]
MKTITTLALTVVAFLFVRPTQATDNPLDDAARPMEEGVPQVAVLRLRKLLRGSLTPAEKKAATEKLGEALLAAGAPNDALKTLEDVADSPAVIFYRAQALAKSQRWAEALPLYQQIAADAASPFRSEAMLAEAEALRALGRTNEALQAFALLLSDPHWSVRAQLCSIELLLDKQDNAGARNLLERTKPDLLADKKEKRFLQGRLEAQLNHQERAIELFRTILRRPEGASRAVLIATLCAIAEASVQLRTPGAGEDPLEDFIEHHPGDPALPTVFAKLDQVYGTERKPSPHELGRWAKDPAQPRRALSQWYLARTALRGNRRDYALQIFNDLRSNPPPLPALAEAFLEYARLELEEQRFDEASAILDEARALHPAAPVLARINFLSGRSQYSANQFKKAAETFEEVARSSPQLATDSLYNASLAWMQLNDTAHVAADTRAMTQSGGGEAERGDLLLEQGLTQAGQGNKAAAEILQTFLREFSHHQRVAEAWVALAELAFHAAPPNLDEARQNLARARASEPNAAANERADYLSIWIEDVTPNAEPSKTTGAAAQFLQKYPTSPLLTDVRMKLAETYYRQQDFANAETQFQTLAQENPRAGFVERALFFAAKSARQSMGAQSLEHALALFDEVVKKNGELKWAARNEQAMIERQLEKAQDATTLYDEVLRGEAKPEEKREALCGKGDILFNQGANDPEKYRQAIAIYEQLAAQKDATAHWRNQALFKKGICLEKLSDPAQALATFYDIIENAQPNRQREFFWHDKAGFNAARLLETDSKWEAAAAVYHKLASAGGARSEEAQQRLTRLRLEHFLWEQ